MLRSNVRLSDVSVRLSTTLDSAATLTDGDMSRPATPSYKSQLRGGTHGQRYVQRVRLATPSNNFRGYFHSPLTSLDSATFIHWSRLYLTSVTLIHRSHKITFRRTFSFPLSHVQLLSTAIKSHAVSSARIRRHVPSYNHMTIRQAARYRTYAYSKPAVQAANIS